MVHGSKAAKQQSHQKQAAIRYWNVPKWQQEIHIW
jgi:hypothetical protein